MACDDRGEARVVCFRMGETTKQSKKEKISTTSGRRTDGETVSQTLLWNNANLISRVCAE